MRNKKIPHVARYHIMMVSDLSLLASVGLHASVVMVGVSLLLSSPSRTSPPRCGLSLPSLLVYLFALYHGSRLIADLFPPTVAQGVMLDIVAMILIVVEENLPFGVLWSPWSDLFYALMFWVVFLLVVYCLLFCFM